ncbi:hypothetical protein Tco_0246936, partial [Tanacetum coccineum]
MANDVGIGRGLTSKLEILPIYSTCLLKLVLQKLMKLKILVCGRRALMDLFLRSPVSLAMVTWNLQIIFSLSVILPRIFGFLLVNGVIFLFRLLLHMSIEKVGLLRGRQEFFPSRVSLSIGGRLTLIKSVLSSLPLYYMSSFKVPKGVLSKMESIRRNFFNGVENAEKKMSLIGWNKILASKKNGAIYGIRGALDNSSSYSRRSPWLDIVNEARKLASKGIDLLSLVKKKVGNGEATSFWNDVWLGDFPLKQTYLRLYFLKLDKHVSVASKLRANSLISSFRQSPRSGIEEEQLLLLISNTSSVILPNFSDRRSWLLDPSG